jgi:hypothetical protein
MLTVYVRLSDLEEIETACPSGMDSQLDVHIVSDLAWESDEGTSVACEQKNVQQVKNVLQSITVKGIDEQSIQDLRRRFGC